MSQAAKAFHGQIFKRLSPPEELATRIVKLRASLKSRLPMGKLEGKGIMPLNKMDMLQILKFADLHYDEKGKAKAHRPQESAKPAAPTTPTEHPAPYTPDENQMSTHPTPNQLPHRTMDEPAKSALKKSGVRRTNNPIFFPTNVHNPLQLTCVAQAPIQSFKAFGDTLWYIAPGQMVQCDGCERSVPQAMGSLQGAHGASQFAQNAFFCIECRPRQ